MTDAPHDTPPTSYAAWLDECAGYFERRDTHGEDRAFWANVTNAESARKIKSALAERDALLKEAMEALTSIDDEIDTEMCVLRAGTMRDRAAIRNVCALIRARAVAARIKEALG